MFNIGRMHYDGECSKSKEFAIKQINVVSVITFCRLWVEICYTIYTIQLKHSELAAESAIMMFGFK